MIISFNRYNGGGSGSGSTDLTNYWDSAVTEQHIESAASITYASAVSYTDAALADFSLDGYYNSAQTEERIASAASITYASAVSNTNAALSNYTPTSGFSTINGSAITNGGNIVIAEPDVSNYVTSAQVETQIIEKNYITSAAIANMVSSTSVSTIWKGTQAEYDAETTSGQTANPTTLYIII